MTGHLGEVTRSGGPDAIGHAGDEDGPIYDGAPSKIGSSALVAALLDGVRQDKKTVCDTDQKMFDIEHPW